MKSRVVLLIFMVLLAGCGGQSTSPTTQLESSVAKTTEIDDVTSTQQTKRETVVVQGDSLPVEASRVFHNVSAIMRADADPPLINVDRVDQCNSEIVPIIGDEFIKKMGVKTAKPSDCRDVWGYTERNGWVYLRYTDNATIRDIKRTLAHEFAHSIQYRKYGADHLAKRSDERYGEYSETFDNRFVRYSILEGTAVAVEYRYSRVVLSETPKISDMRSDLKREEGSVAFGTSLYYFGAKYVHVKDSDGGSVVDAFDDPPMTTEQLLHNVTNLTDAPTIPETRYSVNNSKYTRTDRNTYGELSVFNVLNTELNYSEARAGAEGWEGDVVVEFSAGSTKGYVWTLKYESPGQRAQLQSAFETSLSTKQKRGSSLWYSHKTNTYYRMEKLDDKTIIIYVGPRPFVTEVSIKIK